MKIKIEIPYWQSHYNMLLYATLFYCERHDLDFKVSINPAIRGNSAVVEVNGKQCYFDYSDDRLFASNPADYDLYFKRSLMPDDYKGNVYPLNFQANYTYKPQKMIAKFALADLCDKKSRVELARAADFFNLFTNLSHTAADIRKLPTPTDNGGRVIFQTRLWNPDSNEDAAEKERRNLQNEFRMNACRLIRKHFPSASVGIYPEKFSEKMAPDLLLDLKQTTKQAYFNALRKSDIGIADEGLKDTPGWKVSEYLMFGKALISTPFHVVIENFEQQKNYLELSGRSSFTELPDQIEYLLADNKYLQMGQQNLLWSNEYLHPMNYLPRILKTIENHKP